MRSTNDAVREIKTEYGNDSYVGISGDSSFDNVSQNLRKLWYSPDEMSVANIDVFYNRILDSSYPDYTAEVFEEDARILKNALAEEFALIIKSKS